MALPGQARTALWHVAVPLLGLGLAGALAVAAVRAQRSHRAAAERVLRDYAGVAGAELVRRAAFDLGFNGLQVVGAGLRRTAAAGQPALPPKMYPDARALPAHLFLLDARGLRQLSGGPPPAGLEEWIRAEAAALPEDRDPFVVRRRADRGGSRMLALLPIGEGLIAAFDVQPEALAPYLRRALDRGPLLPAAVGDGAVGNGSLSLAVLDPAGDELLRHGAGRWPEWEVEVPFGDFYRAVLEGCRVRVALDPAAAGRLLPGGLPRSQLPALALLFAGALLLAVLGVAQARRERAFVQLREEFVAGVSHELRTPLAQIRLFTETVLLGRCRSPEEERRFLEAAARETLRLGQLVDNVLDFSRAERGLLDVHPAPRRLAPLVASVARVFEPLAAARKVRLALALDESAGAAIDETAFTRLLLNLLDNAVKYGPEAGEVTVRVRSAGAQVELAVEDRGPGVPAAEREAIFAAFHRLERDRRSAATGAGIGLSIVRALAERHGGACRVEDREGGGARFVVTLPGATGAA